MPAALRTRPTAETFPLDDLVDLAWEGQIRIPSFQRGLKWTQRDVVQLFDSILNGFPVGSLLFWARQAPAETVTLGPLRIEAAAGEAFYVVDGQQRITALAAALRPDGEGDQRFQVGYDLQGRKFVARPARTPGTYVPAHVLWDLSGLLSWFRERPELGEFFDDAAGVSKALRDVKIPAYVVRQDDEETLRTIFDRMNTAGKKLTRGEVFAALHRPDHDGSEITLRSVAEALQARTGFGLVDDGTRMQIVLARRGPDVTREIRNEFSAEAKGRDASAAGETQAQAFERGTEAAVAAITFMQQVARVPHVAFLPNQFLLVTLVRFFGFHPVLSRRQQRLLRRFFWRAAVAGPALSRGSTSGVSRILNRQIVADDAGASLAALLSLVSAGPQPPYPEVELLRTNTADGRTLLCAMWQRGPRALTTGEPTTDSELRSALDEHSTAGELVQPLVAPALAGHHDKDAGNRLLLVSAVDRESDVQDLLAAAGDDVLASHLLERDELAAITVGRVEAAIVARTQRLRRLLDDFLDRMCEWDHEDTPDLKLLIHGDDESSAVTGRSELNLGDVARETVGRAALAWPDVAERWLGEHPDVRDAMTDVITVRTASLGGRD